MSSFAMNTTRRHLRLSSTTVSLMKLCAKSVTCACVGWTRDTCVHFTRPVTQSPHLNLSMLGEHENTCVHFIRPETQHPHLNVSMLGEHETRAFISSDLRPSSPHLNVADYKNCKKRSSGSTKRKFMNWSSIRLIDVQHGYMTNLVQLMSDSNIRRQKTISTALEDIGDTST